MPTATIGSVKELVRQILVTAGVAATIELRPLDTDGGIPRELRGQELWMITLSRIRGGPIAFGYGSGQSLTNRLYGLRIDAWVPFRATEEQYLAWEAQVEAVCDALEMEQPRGSETGLASVGRIMNIEAPLLETREFAREGRPGVRAHHATITADIECFRHLTRGAI